MKYTFLFLLALPFLGHTQQRILHYDETTGFNHGTRTVSFNYFKSLEAELNVEVNQDSDGSKFRQDTLMTYDLIIFSNTSGNSGLSASQQDALEWFIDVKGGGLLGIHAATDTYRHSSANGGGTGAWDWYAETMGGSVQTSPNHTSQNHINDISIISSSSITSGLMNPWTKQEEYYYWENGYLNADIVEILRVGDTGGNSFDDPRPVAWQRTNSVGSRIFYTSLGHKTENFAGPGFPGFRLLLENATEWALQAGATVPVELVSFKGYESSDRQSTHLKWSTSSEVNADFFEVQSSSDSKHWHTLGKVKAAGNSNTIQKYEFQDRSPSASLTYYRLKQIDLNKSYKYSKTIQIQRKKLRPVKAYPNPTKEKITLEIDPNISDGQLQISTIHGKLIRTILFEDSETIEVDLSADQVGIYFIDIVSGNQRQTLKIVKI